MQQQVEVESFDCLRRILCGSLWDLKKFDVIHEDKWEKLS
jgi:hypothetical protein